MPQINYKHIDITSGFASQGLGYRRSPPLHPRFIRVKYIRLAPALSQALLVRRRTYASGRGPARGV